MEAYSHIRIGIIGAMDDEVDLLRREANAETPVRIADMDFCEGIFDGRSVVIAKCGVGKVNAAICAQIMITRFHVTHIINTGVAGSLDTRVRIGDLVISTDAVQHDMDVTPFGCRRGEFLYSGLFAFPADEGLRRTARAAAEESGEKIGIFEGRVCSGDQFIASRAQKEDIKQTFDGLCCEMEGAAIAQVCHLNHTPWVILRAISDCADDSEEISFAIFVKSAAMTSARIVRAFISRLE